MFMGLELPVNIIIRSEGFTLGEEEEEEGGGGG